MLDLGTVIDPHAVKTELSLKNLKKEAHESSSNAKSNSSETGSSAAARPIELKKEAMEMAEKSNADKEKVYNFPDDPSKENSPEMQGNEENDPPEVTSEDGDPNDWCAVCHDGGDTLYCCDRCPKVYHTFCFIPPLTEEPPDDWVCTIYRVGHMFSPAFIVCKPRKVGENIWPTL